jgi:hypothetical protein
MRTKGHLVNLNQSDWRLTLTQGKDAVRRDAMPAGTRNGARRRAPRHRVWPAWILGAGVAAGCTGGSSGGPHRQAAPLPAAAVPARGVAAGSLVRVPVPDYASPESVAAAFYTAWASTDAVHDGPGAAIVRCAPLVTALLEAQLAASQPATAAWEAIRRDRMVSLVRVQAVTRPDGAPAPTSQAVYLRVYAVRVTTSTAGRTAVPDGITVQLARTGGRWLVSRVLFF